MDAKLVNPIVNAFIEVMPQIGFPAPRRLRIYRQGNIVLTNGVTVTVSFTRKVCGSVIYNMTEETAKFVASTMMMGVPVTQLSDMVQSSIREVGNMLAARAATNFSQLELDCDITPPELSINQDPATRANDDYFTVEMELGEHRIDIAIRVESD